MTLSVWAAGGTPGPRPCPALPTPRSGQGESGVPWRTPTISMLFCSFVDYRTYGLGSSLVWKGGRRQKGSEWEEEGGPTHRPAPGLGDTTSELRGERSRRLPRTWQKDEELRLGPLATAEGQRVTPGASLVAQWLGIHLPMQGTRVPALVREDPTCRRATKPVHHNY